VLPAGLLAGAVLFGGAVLQQIGMVWTTAGKAGFITGLYVVLVPLAGLLWGERAGWARWVAALLAAAGLFLLSVTNALTLERGDLFVLAGALFWTAHVRLLGWLSPRTDPVALSCVQFAVCALLSGAAAALSEPLALDALLAAGIPILYGGLLSVGVAYTLQVVAQRREAPASRAPRLRPHVRGHDLLAAAAPDRRAPGRPMAPRRPSPRIALLPASPAMADAPAAFRIY
jgi:drug/metabolite transporter (DMT)-like permease